MALCPYFVVAMKLLVGDRPSVPRNHNNNEAFVTVCESVQRESKAQIDDALGGTA
jgi:hypothetical protein